MSCNGDNNSGKTKWIYTGNEVGFLNHVGPYNFVAGGPAGSGISAGVTVPLFFPNTLNRRPWQNDDAKMNDSLLDAAYPNIDLQWFAEIQLDPNTIFRVSNRAFYVTDSTGASRFYDARAEKPPVITVDAGEWLSPSYKVSDLQLVLNNRDGYFNDYLPYGTKFVQWAGAKVTVKIGFSEKYENYYTLFEGQVSTKQGLSTTRDSIDIRAYDKFDIDEVPIPTRVFSSDVYPNISSDQAGKAVPLLYGDWTQNVPFYGAVKAICTNALEVLPTAYNFKISDQALASIDSVWLHRGDRAADKPAGPLHITNGAISKVLASGEFNLLSNVPVLDEPHVILLNQKAAPGTTSGLIASDGTIDFVDRGIKIGDFVTNATAKAAILSVGNLQFVSLLPGTAGNSITVQADLNAVDDTANRTAPTVSVSGTAITIGFPRYHDSTGAIVIGGNQASQIKAAINANSAANHLVFVKYVGTVPTGNPLYGTYTRPSDVYQSTFSAQNLVLSATQGSELVATIRSVSNFQLTIDNSLTFAAGDEYSVQTYQYTYTKNDKISIVCQGKPLNLLSVNRLSDLSPLIRSPQSISVGFDNTYWFSDDTTQKIYNATFKNKILQTIPYSALDPSVTRISGVCVSNDNKLWAVDPDHSQIYQYDHFANAVGVTFNTSQVTGIGTALGNISGIVVQPDNRIWIVDQSSSTFYLIDAFQAVIPALIRSFNNTAFNSSATALLDVAYDTVNHQVLTVDRATNSYYRLNQLTGALISQTSLTNLAPNVSYVSGMSVAQDGTLFFMEASLLSIYNYNDSSSASSNPAFIARDLLQQFGGHTYNDFDLSWNQTATQLATFKSRVSIDKQVNMITYINGLLRQFNTVFSLRFGKFSLFFITFANFRTNGRLVTEKDIKAGSFKPEKEINQYFNAATASYATAPFDSSYVASDHYVSTSGISFAGGKEVLRDFDMSAVYRRQDIDYLMPLFVRLAVPEPEFVTATFGFRLIRSQIQDFITLLFDGDVNMQTGKKQSGRRFNNVPCMIRKMTYDLGPMTIQMKLWSLGTTPFNGYTPPGKTVGGQSDKIVLTNLGRLGRISPTGTITAAGTNTLTLAVQDGATAQARSNAAVGLCWKPGYKVALTDGITKSTLQVLTIQSVSANTITFVENITATASVTSKNAAGFISGGTFVQYAPYDQSTSEQLSNYASFSLPSSNYPVSASQEIADQRGGLHSFADGGLPYVLYPAAFTGF
jgi:hypothetical protein